MLNEKTPREKKIKVTVSNGFFFSYAFFLFIIFFKSFLAEKFVFSHGGFQLYAVCYFNFSCHILCSFGMATFFFLRGVFSQ